MLLKFKKSSDLTDNDVTDEKVWQERRSLLRGMGFLGASTLLSQPAHANLFGFFDKEDDTLFKTEPLVAKNTLTTSDQKTDEAIAITYNNFYEFGTGKDDPHQHAQAFKVDPWSLTIDGLVENPVTLSYEDIYKKFPLEERIYRLRCVEAWSMVIPWIGFPLHQLIKQVKPLSSAKYLAFETLYDPEQMRGQRNHFVGGGIDFPYIEGLRIDEAMQDLTILGVGMYGKTLPPQNGAPIRLIVPWKYGFKSIKSVVRIKFTDKEPATTWNILAPQEYGFYANVNPTVDHPRWSQKRERRILGTGLTDQERIDTVPFNGYPEVAELYKDLDLTRFY